MNANFYWIGYILGVAMVVVGILVLLGYFQFRGSAGGGGMLRTVFGIVLLLYGIYRISLTTMQRRRKEREL
jgi:uncharacterized membrane protein YkgB